MNLQAQPPLVLIKASPDQSFLSRLDSLEKQQAPDKQLIVLNSTGHSF